MKFHANSGILIKPIAKSHIEVLSKHKLGGVCRSLFFTMTMKVRKLMGTMATNKKASTMNDEIMTVR